MKNFKKIMAILLLGTALTSATPTYSFNVKRFVTSRYGLGVTGLSLMAASRILSFMASENTAAYNNGQLAMTDIIDNQRELSFYLHNSGGFLFLLSLGSKLCAFLALLRLLGGFHTGDLPDIP